MEYSPTILMLYGAIGLAGLCVWSWVFARLLLGRKLVEYEPRREVPWNGWDVIFVTAIMLVALSLAGMLRVRADADAGHALPGPADSRANLLTESIAKFAGLALAIVYLVLRRGATASDLGLSARKLAYDVPLGFVTFLAATLPVFGLMLLLTRWILYTHPLVERLQELPDRSTLWLAIFTAVVVAPIVEEFFFRVLLQGWLEAGERRWRDENSENPAGPPLGIVPILVSSLFFALMHMGQGPAPVPLFVLALFLGFLYQRTHRWAPSLVLHLCLNAVSLAILWLSLTNPTG